MANIIYTKSLKLLPLIFKVNSHTDVPHDHLLHLSIIPVLLCLQCLSRYVYVPLLHVQIKSLLNTYSQLSVLR